MEKATIKFIIIWSMVLFPAILKAQVPSRLVTALRYKDQLKLTTGQVSKLKAQTVKLNDLKATVNTDTNKFISDQLAAILSKEQYQAYLQFFRQVKADYWAKHNWQLLKELGLAKNIDSSRTYSQNFIYEINKANALEKAANSNNPDYKSLIRDSVLTIRPLLLLKLDAYKNTLPKWSRFANVISFRNELNLSDNQVDSLISRFAKLEKIKLAYKFNHEKDNNSFKRIEFESILNELGIEKFDMYLSVKTQSQAVNRAKADWQNLQKYGLSQGLDSAKTNKEIQAYEVKWLIANERLAMNNSQKNAFDKKDIEDKRPQILKSLEEAIADTHKNEKF